MDICTEGKTASATGILSNNCSLSSTLKKRVTFAYPVAEDCSFGGTMQGREIEEGLPQDCFLNDMAKSFKEASNSCNSKLREQKWDRIGKEVAICVEMVKNILEQIDVEIDSCWPEDYARKVASKIREGHIDMRGGIRQIFDYNRKLLRHFVLRANSPFFAEKFMMRDGDNVMWRMSVVEHGVNMCVLLVESQTV
jgi:hypothetical protein